MHRFTSFVIKSSTIRLYVRLVSSLASGEIIRWRALLTQYSLKSEISGPWLSRACTGRLLLICAVAPSPERSPEGNSEVGAHVYPGQRHRCRGSAFRSLFWVQATDVPPPASLLQVLVFSSFNTKGNQPWTFIGRADAEAETPILWPPDAKSRLVGKDPDVGKDWGEGEKEFCFKYEHKYKTQTKIKKKANTWGL